MHRTYIAKLLVSIRSRGRNSFIDDKMQRNVEIKAKVQNLSDLLKRAKDASKSNGTVLKQMDVFFHSKTGRLKLREEENDKGKEAWLIFYDRPDTDGPKLSTYNKSFLGTSGQELRAVLAAAQGERLVVEKTRHLFMVGQTRIHIDEVKGLGSFMELEVGLTEEESVEDGQAIAEKLMAQLNISDSDLVTVAYADLLDKPCSI